MAFLQEELINYSAKGWQGILGSGDRNSAPDNLAPWEEISTNGIIISPRQMWTQLDLIPSAPTLLDAQQNALLFPTIIEDRSTVAVHCTPSPNNKLFFATTTFGDLSTRLKNWILPQLISRTDGSFKGFPSIGYMVRLYNGDPNSGGIEIPTTQEKSGGVPGWFMNFSEGAIKVASSFSSIIDPSNVFITGFRYIGLIGGSGGANELNDLVDVNIQTGLSDGDVLVYNSTTGQWENQTIPTNYTKNDTVNPFVTKVIDSIALTSLKTAEWTIYLTSNSKYRASKILALNKNNTDIFYNEFSVLGEKINNVKLLVQNNLGNLELLVENNSYNIVDITILRIISN